MTAQNTTDPTPTDQNTADPQDRWADSGLDLDGLRDQVAGLSGRINAATCQWLGLVAEADERKAWHGFASCVAWLSWQCGIGPGTASDHVRVARALAELPLIRRHFAAGALSFSQVRAITRARGILDEQTLLDLAQHATGAQLERLVRGLRKAVTPKDEDDAARRQEVTWRVEPDGSFILRARLTGEAAATMAAALETAQTTGEPCSRAEALTTVATAALDALSADSSRDQPPADVTLVADLDALVEATTPDQRSSAEDSAVSWEPHGVPASTRTLATLLCDRQINLIARLRDGTLVDLGRSRRRPNTRISKAVLRRHDHRCAVPTCRSRRHLHLHHIRHWAHGGSTSIDNLLPLCGRHHRALHAGELSITPEGNGWAFHDRFGARIRPIAATPKGSGVGLPHDAWPAADLGGRGICEITNRADPLHLNYAVSVLLPSA